MLDKILKEAVNQGLKDPSQIKKHLTTGVVGILKKYRNYFFALLAIVIVFIILAIWLVWSLFAGVLSVGVQHIPGSASAEIAKIQEVGINWLIAEPVKLLQDLWYGKDGK
jgi:hypothetical protein